jgi:hypothetical protein
VVGYLENNVVNKDFSGNRRLEVNNIKRSRRLTYYQIFSKIVVQIATSMHKEKSPIPIATGFFIADFRNAEKEGNVLIRLITNKHVLYDLNENGKILKNKDDIVIITNLHEEYNRITQSTRILDDCEFEFSPHNNNLVDIVSVIISSKYEDQMGDQKEDIKAISETDMMEFDEIDEGDQVFFLGFPSGLGISSQMQTPRDKPILRQGTIAYKNYNSKSFLIDGFSFPGSSGSPVFIKKKNYSNDIDIRLVGCIARTFSYTEPLISRQTGKTKMIFEDNMGLSEAYSCDTIIETLKPPKKIGGR